MARYLLLTFTLLLAGVVAMAQTSLQGSVKDADSDEAILYGNVALYRGGVLITGTQTDFDGYYSITELDPGTYDVVFSYTGYQELKIEGVTINAGKANTLDAQMSAGVTLTEVVVKYKPPLVEKDNTTQGKTLTSEEIRNLPTRNVNALASLSAGVGSADAGGDLTIRGSRSDATNYYVDGIRVRASSVPNQSIEQMQVITGGMEARYGDVTGGIVSITTKGPSEAFSGGVEMETSRKLDAFDQDLLSLSLSGPLLKSKGKTLLGYRILGQYTYQKDDDPPAIPVYQVKDDVLAALEANPIRILGNTVLPEAQWLTNDGVNVMDYNPNEERTAYDVNAKLDANLGKNVDVTFSGIYGNIDNKFTPGGWQVFNSHNNPTTFTNRYSANARLRHRLGGTMTNSGDDNSKGSFVQNAVYTLQFGYERSESKTADPRHGDRYFDYGYIGNFDLTWNPSITAVASETDTSFILTDTHVDYSRRFNGFTPNTEINPVLTRYIDNPQDKTDFADFTVINGRIPDNLANVWTNLHSNVGLVYNSNNKNSFDLYTFNANTSFELVPGGSGGGRHQIQFGILYEQTTNRNYTVGPRGLWTIARLHANEHIEGQGLDSLNVLYTIPGLRQEFTFFETIIDTIDVPVYAPNIVTDNKDNQFFRRVREKFNIPLNQYINVDGLSPNDLSLDLFSARELNDLGVVNYFGYDYLGNKLDDVTFEDFFTTTDANGVRTFPVAAFSPNYQAAFIQDKFTYKDVIFRLGLRVDRYDANSKVLKDPYSLYDVMTAKDFSERFNMARPGNIGDDFKVYVTSDGGEIIQAYRDQDTWYFPNGTPANDGSDIFGGGLVYPRYAEEDETKRDVTNANFDPDVSFKDYEPQINWMPRMAFSFPISDEANFFAHYDVLVQRPPSNSFVSPLTYFYWETSGSGIRSNANLRPERTVDYEVGFQQSLSESSALKLSAYYKELRDMIQSRYFLYIPAPVNQYQTYDNLDFATVKGFSISYDLRRTGNIQLNLAYTLQFADGTGSDANSSRGLGSRGIQRTLFPMSYDERHRINAVIDYRYGSGKAYNGPRIGGLDILANAGINITTVAVSGRPYTAAIQPDVLGSRGIKGAINGARLPWTFRLDARLDKSFTISKPGAKRGLDLNVYMRVSNLLDRRNVLGVYRYTGSPSDDGFLNSAQGQAFLLGGFSQGQSLDAYLASYQWRLLNPDLYSLPRRIFLGAIFDF